MQEAQEAVLCNNVLAGLSDYSAKADSEYHRALIYGIFVGEARNIDAFQVGLKNELDNIHDKLPEHWRYYFKYTTNKPKFGSSTDVVRLTDELFIDLRTDKRIWMVNKKIKNLLDHDNPLQKAKTLALLSHAGQDTEYMRAVRDDLLGNPEVGNDVKWILTADERYMKDEFVRKYWAWLFYLGGK